MSVPPVTESSWGDMLRSYKRARARVPWSKAEQEPPCFVTRYQKSREEREFAPIRQSFRDVGREGRLKVRETQDMTATLNRANEKRMKYSQTYDIINHTTKLPGLILDCSMEQEANASGRGWWRDTPGGKSVS